MAKTYTKVQLRRGTASQWTSYNTLLDNGEIGFETDTYRFKIGQTGPTGELIPWRDLDYFGESASVDQITIDGSLNMGPNACVNGDFIPCADNTYTLGEAARRWKNAHVGEAIQLGDRILTVGPASEATGEDQIFLKINGDDIATRTELEKVTTQNLKLRFPTDPIPGPTEEYLSVLFEVLESYYELPPMDGIQTQSQFNAWVIAALNAIDQKTEGINIDNENNNIIIDGDGLDVIIGNPPGPDVETCKKSLDIYNHTTVHCELHALDGVYVKGQTQKHFVKANGTVSDELPLEQSRWIDVPTLTRSRR